MKSVSGQKSFELSTSVINVFGKQKWNLGETSKYLQVTVLST